MSLQAVEKGCKKLVCSSGKKITLLHPLLYLDYISLS